MTGPLQVSGPNFIHIPLLEYITLPSLALVLVHSVHLVLAIAHFFLL